MTTQVIDAAPTSALAVAIRETGISEQQGKDLLEAFQPFFNQAMTLVKEAEAINVTDPADAEGLFRAREKRLALVKIRTGAEKARVKVKDEALRLCKSIDKVASVIPLLTEGVEARLMDMEKMVERAEAARKAKLKAERAQALAPYGVNPELYKLDEMSADQFTSLLADTKAGHEARLAAEKKAAEERAAAEKARAEEDARIRAENERLRKEKEAAEQAAAAERAKAEKERRAIEDKARKEREAAEAEAKKERAAREKLEQEKAEAERKEKARKDAEVKAARAAARAPDAVKIRTLAAAVRNLDLPECVTAEGKVAVGHAKDILESTSRAIAAVADQIA